MILILANMTFVSVEADQYNYYIHCTSGHMHSNLSGSTVSGCISGGRVGGAGGVNAPPLLKVGGSIAPLLSVAL